MRFFRFQFLAAVMTMMFLQGCSTFNGRSSLRSSSHRQMMCLAEAIHGEARGEPEDGKIFVGRVIVTRVEKGYGKNYCDVVYSKRQFAPKKKPQKASVIAAHKSHKLGPNGVTHFHSYKHQKTSAAAFSQSPRCEARGKVGAHWGFTCYEYGLRKTASTQTDLLAEPP